MSNWKKLLISPETSLKEAIEVLNNGAERIALVVNQDNRLRGTLTDGDIRRALIRHMTLDAKVEDVMCKTPKKAHEDWKEPLIFATMEKYHLLQLPIVDASDKVIGLKTLHDFIKSSTTE